MEALGNTTIAAEQPSPAAPSGSGDLSGLSDEQVLDKFAGETASPEAPATSEGSEAPPEGGEAPPSGEAVAAPAEAAAAETQEEMPEGPVAETEALKAIFKTPGVGPELRRSYFAEKAYRELFPSVQDARQLREIFPTAEEAKAAASDREEFAKFDELFYGNTPESHGQFIRSLHDEDPEIFQSLAVAFPQSVYELNPDLYRERIAGPIVRSTLASIRQMAEQSGDENLQNAADVLAHRLFNQTLEGGGRPRYDAHEIELQRREASLNQREQEQVESTFRSFRQAASDRTVEKVIGDIEGLVKKSLPEGTADTVTRKVVRDIYNELEQNLASNRELNSQLRRAYQTSRTSRNFGEQAQAGLVGLVYGRAKQALPGIARKVVSEWTQGILRSSQERLSKQRTAASRVELGSGAAPGTAGAGKPDFGKMTDQQVLEYFEKR